uniref:Large ribosomal subunit protein uL5 n=1 Tax=uncultured korarchaeote TaxID=161241 RepID=A0A1L2JT64_9CREN|nr:ribosomal protein L5 [uncultured korarchaeote]
MTSEAEIEGRWRSNPMLVPRLSKVVLNICVGRSGDPLERAKKVLEQLSGQKPSVRTAKKTIKGFGIRKGEPIACCVTIRGQRAEEMLKRLFQAVGNKIKESSIDNRGNFAFGIKEHLMIPGVEYDPKIGIFGMDVCVSLERPGYRIARRKIARRRIPQKAVITREEAIYFLKKNFGIEVIGG